MLEMLMQWYRRRFSDPEAIALLVILVAGFGIIFFFSGLLAPLLVAIVLAYLLEWPTGADGVFTHSNLTGTSIPHALKNRPNGSFSVTAGADARLKKPLASTTVTG
ncbi:hypothetical protein BX98_08920 [Escherichia coli O26:H11 str. 2011C-3387]|nr:hypothetical protein BX98_08920 [Escherichia coli O26:H11 str. 2011C-3387]